MDNIEQYQHWYYMSVVANGIKSILKDQYQNTWNNFEFKYTKILDAKIAFYDKLLKGDNKK